jgi:NADH dehydrogenase [ubiquinone] 1 alpha subcomplex assembly factor 1
VRGQLVPRKSIITFANERVPWLAITDAVMGGVSRAEMAVSGGVGVFSGVVSLDRNGGFASVRSEAGDHDLSRYAGLEVRVRGDGKLYGLRLRTTAAFDGVSYQVEFVPEAGGWCELRFPFASFEPVFRGHPVSGHPPLDAAAINTFGLIISGRQEGPFRLELASIAGYREPVIGYDPFTPEAVE